MREIAREVRGPIIAGLARCNREDIDKAWSAVREAARPRLHVFLATSAIHREHKLNMAKEQIIHTAVEGVKYARSLCADVEFSPEDASRTELEFLREVVEAVIEAGATTINVPDTVGYTVPEEFHEVFDYLKKNVRGADRVVFSVHCHDDLGMAVANSLAAVRAGARQVECTINGIGERAGNCSLEEIVMAMKTREALLGFHTGIDTKRLFPTSRLLSSITGMTIPRNKAVVGENAFAHESGIHQHGMLKHHSTYEIMRPEDVGLTRIAPRARQAQRPRRAARSHQGARLRAERRGARPRVRGLQVAGRQEEGTVRRRHRGAGAQGRVRRERPVASREPSRRERLRRRRDGARRACATATAACCRRKRPATARSTRRSRPSKRPPASTVTLRKFEVRSVSMGEDAQGEAVVTVEHNGRAYRGSSVTTDIVESGVRAFLEVVNRIESTRATTARMARNPRRKQPPPRSDRPGAA